MSSIPGDHHPPLAPLPRIARLESVDGVPDHRGGSGVDVERREETPDCVNAVEFLKRLACQPHKLPATMPWTSRHSRGTETGQRILVGRRYLELDDGYEKMTVLVNRQIYQDTVDSILNPAG